MSMIACARRPGAVLLAALFFTMAAAGAAAPAEPLRVETRHIRQSTDLYDVDVAYPATGVDAIDAAIGGWASHQVDVFTTLADEPSDLGLKLSLDITFDVARNDGTMFAVDFEKVPYLGGAHPGFEIDTFNFTLPDGWRFFLPEIFRPAALKRISALAVADLTRRLTAIDAAPDPDWIKNGAGPAWDNFGAFLLLPDKLVIRFPPYQVSSYAVGPQSAEIPLSKLSGLMRDNWHVAVPSFDCAKARSAPEKAICSDIALARLDRALAADYRRALDFAEDGMAIKSAQHAWLKTRDACGGDIGCLKDAYEARIKALNVE